MKQENINEAENIFEWYYEADAETSHIDFISKSLAIKLAIQDRQSVLEDNQSVLEMLLIHGDDRTRLPIRSRITNLTEQINYLKSKL